MNKDISLGTRIFLLIVAIVVALVFRQMRESAKMRPPEPDIPAEIGGK